MYQAELKTKNTGDFPRSIYRITQVLAIIFLLTLVPCCPAIT